MKSIPEAENAAYDTLKRILSDGAYSSVELDRTLEHASENCRAKITALVYGVLDKSVTLDYVINKLTKKMPKTSLVILLKLGLYELLFGNIPAYAAVDKYVEIAKARMRGTEGFVNAVLRAGAKFELPSAAEDNAESLSVACSRPIWLVRRLIDDLGCDRTRSVLSAKLPEMTHIRRNRRVIGETEFKVLIESTGENIRSERGYYVTRTTLKRLDPSIYTAQSLSSIYTAEAYTKDLSGDIRILDLCAAPGGKSVYMSELLPESKITACDVHSHRVNLIKAYSGRMKTTNVRALQWDAVKVRDEWKEQFDLVVCDVPCTGSGLLCSSPDILLGKSDEDVLSLSVLQHKILENAALYVKRGGRLAYSTCSLLKTENECVTDEFILTHPEYMLLTAEFGTGNELNGTIRFYPDLHKCDGFYIARFIKK